MGDLNTGNIDFEDAAVDGSLASDNFLNSYLTQIRFIGRYLTWSTEAETSSHQVGHRDLQESMS